MKKFPRSLRMPEQSQNRKARITAKRRQTAGRLIARYRADAQMELGRQINALRSLFSVVGEKGPVELLRQKQQEKKAAGKDEKCVVLDIGCRTGLALQSLAMAAGFVGKSSGVQFVGMDALTSSKSPLANVRLATGNILSKPFPRTDIAFSMAVLGYAGNTGFLVRKTASALKPNGIAVLHINKKGRAQFSDSAKGIAEGQMITLIKDMPKLARQLEKMRLRDCSIRVFAPPDWGGNLAVLIRKK